MKPELYISPEETIRTALKKMDINGFQILLVVGPDKHLLGTLSDGDIRRLILNGIDISEMVDGLYHKKPLHFVAGACNSEEIKQTFLKHKIRLIPVVDNCNKIIEVITWDKVFSGGELLVLPKRSIDVDVVVMAGGKGTRLAPFTDILPKPLIPVGNKTILEHIIDGFLEYNVRRYFMTVNYKGEMIRAYFDSIDKEYKTVFVKEEVFCGTAGSLILLPEDISETFIVSNCDILVKANYADVLDFHRSSGAMLTMIASIHHHTIPYGVVRFQNGGEVVAIEEKPEYTVQINTGVYVLNKECLKYIQTEKMFHMTHLIESLLADGKKVVAYPVNEGDYIDIGQWEEYKNALSRIG